MPHRRSKTNANLSAAERRSDAENRKAAKRSRLVDGPYYPQVTVQLSGMDGNAMAIVGRVRRALDRAGINDDVVETFVRQALSGDYDHVIQTCMKWVDVE